MLIQIERVVFKANNFWRPTNKLTDGTSRAMHKNIVNASLKLVEAVYSYFNSYRLTKVRVAVPVKMVSTQNELKAEVGFLARNEKM